MNEEKKYSVVGTVTIGTDEYRDLIEALKDAEHRVDSYMRQGWDKDSKISDLKKDVDKLTEENKKLKSLFKKADATKDDFVAMFFSAE